jgi:hypothetical protein
VQILSSARAFIAFWGAELHYPAHLHEAEELYYVLAGSAEFHSQGEPSAQLVSEGTRYHASNQRHAMDTRTQPVLTPELWRGHGLDGSAKICSAMKIALVTIVPKLNSTRRKATRAMIH